MGSEEIKKAQIFYNLFVEEENHTSAIIPPEVFLLSFQPYIIHLNRMLRGESKVGFFWFGFPFFFFFLAFQKV